jgi:hypothetical protein
MDCTQIRKRLSDPIGFHAPDVLEHIRKCDGCRAEYEAEGILRHGLAVERARVPVSDFGTASGWVALSIQQERTKIMPSIFRQPFATPARRWGLGITLAALAFLVLIPLPYQHTIGTRLTLSSSDPAMAKIDLAAIQSRLSERGLSDVSVTQNADKSAQSLTYSVHGTKDAALAAFAATRDLVPAAAANGQVAFEPWVVQESGSLLAQITGRSFDYTVTTSGKTDAQVAAEIRSQLESQGMQVQNLTVSRTDTSSTMDMTLTPPGGEGTAVIKQVVNGNDVSGKPVEGSIFMPQVDKSLPIDQQVASIKQQLAAHGITNVDVSVVDGKIKVEAKNEIRK